MANLFNRTLAVLALVDNIYIACDLLESLYWEMVESDYEAVVLSHIFPYIIWPLQVGHTFTIVTF